MGYFKKYANAIEYKLSMFTNSSYTRYLRKKGIKIGEDVVFTNRYTLDIDLHKPSLIEIGNRVFINRGFSLLTHDYVTFCFLPIYHDYVSSQGKVKIGNNVAFGRNVTVLKGVSIGDNVFIGYGSIVTKDIPSNSIAIGSPAKVICSLNEFYQKRKESYLEEAVEYAQSIKERFGRDPVIEDFFEEFPLFINGSDSNKYLDKLPIKSQLGTFYTEYCKEHKSYFANFEEFMDYTNKK